MLTKQTNLKTKVKRCFYIYQFHQCLQQCQLVNNKDTDNRSEDECKKGRIIRLVTKWNFFA